jgi:hypothetical protein
MDPAPDLAPDPDPTSDPTPFFSDLKDAKNKIFLSSYFIIFSYYLPTGTISSV